MNALISSLRGLKFNDKHNNDIGVVMNSKSIQSPPKKKIKESVPFMNGSYDFSTIASNGEIVYSERQITVVFGLPTDNKEMLQVLYSKAISWLVDVGKKKLIFDVMPDYYFMAEVEDVTSFEELMSFGTLTVTFVAEPFKHSLDYIGTNLWDTFNFEEDYLQDSSYYISGSKNITIYNPGRSIRPIINCTNPMTLVLNGKTHSLSIGDNKVYTLYLNTLSNPMVITGTGTIKFIFRKESI